jgi:hypothetical protein
MPGLEASANVRRRHRRRHRRQARSTGRCEPTVEVRYGRRETGGTPGGAVGAAEEAETKRRDGLSTVACDGRCICTVGEDVGCDEYIDREARPIPGNKSGACWRSARSWIWFRRPFHPDCIYGSIVSPVVFEQSIHIIDVNH